MSAVVYGPTTPDIARDLNTQALALDTAAAKVRGKRDLAIRALRTTDPKRWTYTALAKAVGLTASQVTKICKASA